MACSYHLIKEKNEKRGNMDKKQVSDVLLADVQKQKSEWRKKVVYS